MKLSIVATVYNASGSLVEFCRRMISVAESLTPTFELILVDDGSTDRSLNVALEIQQRDPRIRLVELSKNFGEHRARFAGLSKATGETVFLITSDLEIHPEELIRFWKLLEENPETDAAYGIQLRRTGPFFQRLSGALFYFFIRHLARIQMPPNCVPCRLMRRQFVEALLSYRDESAIFAAICASIGFKQQAIAVNRYPRGVSNYSVFRHFQLAYSTVLSLSSMPIFFLLMMGCFLFISGTLYTLFQIILGFPAPVWGLSSLLTGLILIAAGIDGAYIFQALKMGKKFPTTIIRAIYERNE